jgi:hypothetical protein
VIANPLEARPCIFLASWDYGAKPATKNESPANAGLCTLTHNIPTDHIGEYPRALLRLEALDIAKTEPIMSRVCIILLTRAQFLQNGPPRGFKLDHSKEKPGGDGYAVARAANGPDRRAAEQA